MLFLSPRFQKDIDDYTDHFFKTAFSFSDCPPTPLLDIYEEGDKVTLVAELPQIDKRDLKVEFDKGFISISGNKKSPEGKARVQECSYGEFSRKFYLGTEFDAATVDAKFNDGVLTVVARKKAEAKAKLVEIK